MTFQLLLLVALALALALALAAVGANVSESTTRPYRKLWGKKYCVPGIGW
jgi:hypothetical protein